MLSKLVIKQIKFLAFAPQILAMVFLMPILMYVAFPGFNTAVFPAFMICFMLLTLQSGELGVNRSQVTLTHFPVTWRDYAASLFLFQVVAIIIAGLYTAAFMFVAGRLGAGVFPRLILPKSMSLGIGLSGIMTLIYLKMPEDVARMVAVGVMMALSILPVIYRGQEDVFLPWLSLPLCLLIGLVAFAVCLALSLGLTRPMQRRPA
ncbi:MAG: ABC-2 transporter permease [Christensenellales bacterium]|jgi:hypothetical protein